MAWHDRARPLIAHHFSSQLPRFDELRSPTWSFSPRFYVGGAKHDYTDLDKRELATNNRIAAESKQQLLAQLDAIIELVQLTSEPTRKEAHTARTLPVNTTNNIFIVHGHDEEMKQYVARTLPLLKLNPIILHEQPNGGRTIIEKFEKNSEVGFAVVLLSPDDLAYPAKGGDPKKAMPRARQNVVLELGYFAAKLGRERVFALKRGDLEIPTDFSGVIYTPYDAAGNWRFDLVRELRAAGYTVDANALI